MFEFIYYLCAGTTAVRPVTETAQEHTKVHKLQTTNESTSKRDNKKSHVMTVTI
jgi:hypothetical protein